MITEGYKYRIQELAGIIGENAQKIMGLGFQEDIAQFLANMDKKRGLFFADLLTREFAKEKGVSGEGNIKQILNNINQNELFQYIKSKEGEIQLVLDWVKSKQGMVDLKSFNSFDEIISNISNESPEFSEEEELSEVPFDEEVKSYLRSVEYDMGIELGVLALRDFIKLTSNISEIPNTSDVNLLINSINQKEFLYFLKRNENALVTIAQWVDSPLRQEQEGVLTDKIKFIKDKNFKDLSDALEYANEWHTSLPATGVLKNPKAGRIIERYPDGYYWVDLGTNQSTDEAQAMGHCGTDFRATTLLSLRDEKGEPHVTVAYDADEKQVRQVKGKQNKKPVEKYMQYVKEFLQKLVKEDKLVGFEWSYPTFGSDLNDDEVREIMMANKKLYFQQLKKGVQQTVSNLGIR